MGNEIKKIAIGCDHAGYELKDAIIEKLIPVYVDLIKQLKELDENITIQFDESYFVTNPTDKDLETLKKEAKHKLSENEEKILMKKDLTSSNAFSRLFDETISSIKFYWEGEYVSEEEI